MTARIHFGSIEESQRTQGNSVNLVEKEQAVEHDDNESVAGLQELEQQGQKGMQHQQQPLTQQQEQETTKLKYLKAIPTNDFKVKNKLRILMEPITLFDETVKQRRERLKSFINSQLEKGLEIQSDSDDSDNQIINNEYYTYGISSLREARMEILKDSIKRAKDRLSFEEIQYKTEQNKRKQVLFSLYTRLKTFATAYLQIADTRPLSTIRFSPCNTGILTAGWSGIIKLWETKTGIEKKIYHGHKDRICTAEFNPSTSIAFFDSDSTNSTRIDLASGDVNGVVHLWNSNTPTPIASLDGHDMRVSRLSFHPSSKYISTASFDTTWRLWDLETQQTLVVQEGHSREVYCLAWQQDGALIGTAGLDSIARVWDVRVGRSVMVLRSHIKPILAIDWRAGYECVTGGEDGTIRVWDIRMGKSTHTVVGGTGVISGLKFFKTGAKGVYQGPQPQLEPETMALDQGKDAMQVDNDDELMTDLDPEFENKLLDGSFLISSSYDGTIKIYSVGDYKPIKCLATEGKVMSCDASNGKIECCTDFFSKDGAWIGGAGYDRSFKIYHRE